jgi:hypothetical protein
LRRGAEDSVEQATDIGIEHRGFAAAGKGWYRIRAAGVDKPQRNPYLGQQRRFDPGGVCVPPGSLRGAKNSAKAAYDGNPLGGKLNGFLFLRNAQG